MDPIPMSGGELVILNGGLIATFLLWWRWFAPLVSVQRLSAPQRGFWLLFVTPIVCTLLLTVVLKTLASFDVISDQRYVFMYLFLGTTWLGVFVFALPLLGLHPRDDVLERGNGAAALAVAGALLGVTLCFAGGNVGDGPGWWVVVFAAGLATLAYVTLWLALDLAGGASEAVTVDRDRAAGARLAGFLIASGMVLGRAVAGDWTSAAATLADFVRIAWPLALLVAVAVIVERGARPTPERPEPPFLALGAAPSAFYVGMAAVYVLLLPRP